MRRSHLRPPGRPGLPCPAALSGRPAALVVLAAVALAGCGGASKPAADTSAQAAVRASTPAAAMRALIEANPELAGRVRTLYVSSSWSVVESTARRAAHAVVFHLVRGRWLPDRSGQVRIDILGPQPGATAPILPQVAIQFTARTPFVESALWVDGTQLQLQGGGTPTRGTIYGAPAANLRPGDHVAVGYARTSSTGTAVAWVFSVP
jgi:hypothetical protein